MGEGFRSLTTWQKAYQLTLDVYKLTSRFPRDEQYGLVSQIRRAAASVPANIAEGYEREHRKEYVRFLTIAKGSLGELETYLLLSKDLGYIDDEVYGSIHAKRQEVGRLLRGLIKSLAT